MRHLVEVTDETQDELLPTLFGCRIVSIHRKRSDGSDFETGANATRIELNDGRILHFGSWGHDEDGVTLRIENS